MYVDKQKLRQFIFLNGAKFCTLNCRYNSGRTRQTLRKWSRAIFGRW